MDVDANISKLELPIEIPAYIKNVYVKYGNGSEIQTVPVESNGTISIVVPANATALSRVTTRAIKKLKRTTSSIIRDMATELLCSKICIQL